jgi:hypothetical protein
LDVFFGETLTSCRIFYNGKIIDTPSGAIWIY